MKMKWILAGLLAAAVSLSACAADRSPLQARIDNAVMRQDAGAGQEDADIDDAGRDAQRKSSPRLQVPYAADPGDELERALTTEQTRAARMAEAVCLVPEVVRAAAVITGNTAIIGIAAETEMETEPSRLIALKNSVEKAAMAVDPDITHTAVTASEDLFARIAAMTDGAVFPVEATE